VRPLRVLFLLLVFLLLAPAAAQAHARVAAFYYPWYGTAARDGGFWHWSQNGRTPPLDLASDFFPARGAYSSADPQVLAAQMAEIRSAGIGEIITSWWGSGSPENRRLPALLVVARRYHLQVAVHLEPYRGRTPESVLADIRQLETLGIREVYVYSPQDLAPSDWATVNAQLPDVRVFAQTPYAGFAAAGGFDGVYTYDVLVFGGRTFARLCKEAHAAHLVCAPSVGPGYSAQRATGDTRTKPRRLGATYDAMWRAAIAARPDQVTITSYNEWNEGTQIEPARSMDVPTGYQSYDGAYGLVGRTAATAYLERTFCWSRVFAGRAPASESPRRSVAAVRTGCG
jgi:glycoprotein endo-alpha-1,2-mannosidase